MITIEPAPPPAQAFFLLERYVEACITPDTDQDVRTRCSIVRGRIELSILHDEPFNIDENERDLALIAESLGDESWRNKFLSHLRLVAGRARLPNLC